MTAAISERAPDRGRTAVSTANRWAAHTLRKLRKRHGWSQAEAALRISEALGFELSARTLISWETGQRAVPAAAFFVFPEIQSAVEGRSDSPQLAFTPAGLAEYTARLADNFVLRAAAHNPDAADSDLPIGAADR